jgi:hypothetical protein
MSGDGRNHDRAPFYDGTGFPRWKVLMEAHLQARGLDVWRVTIDGKRNENKAERQHDAIARSILLSSLCDSVFNRVFACTNAHELWTQIVENHEGSKDVANHKYHILGKEFNAFKQFDNENAHDMYSRLNTLVNEINALGVQQVSDGEVNRKIIQSLRKPDYDIIITLLHKERLDDLKPNQIINQIIAHEYSLEIYKKQESSSQSEKSLAAKHTCKHQPRRQEQSSSEEEEEESDDETSSSEDESTSRIIRYHHDKVATHVRKLYMLGYETRIREDAVGVFKMAGKKKNKLKRHQALPAVRSRGRKDEGSSKDESSKHFTTRRALMSSSHTCLMAKGNSNVSDDEPLSSDDDESDEICEMMNLIQEQQEHLIKQKKEIKALKAKEELHASFVSRYENLLDKFNLLTKEHEELEEKFNELKSLQCSSDSSIPCDIPCIIPVVKVDASTSCDLTLCNEHVVVEPCDDLIARENDELKQEVEKLRKDLVRLKGKAIEVHVKPPQDNLQESVKKLEKGSNVTCFICHQEGHKSYQCKVDKGKPKNLSKNNKKNGTKKAKEEIKKSPQIKASMMYTKPSHKKKQQANPYVLEKKKNGKVVAHKQGGKHHGWNRSIWVPKSILEHMDGTQKVWVPKT